MARKYKKRALLPIARRLIRQVAYDVNTGCWNWTGYIGNNRYGQISVDGRMKKAHRVSYELFNGPITNKLCVLHKCDNTKCVNPVHLFLGTQKDNVHDMEHKGRGVKRRGSEASKSKLSELQVINIRQQHSTGNFSYAELGRQYKVSDVAIRMIVLNRVWRHV